MKCMTLTIDDSRQVPVNTCNLDCRNRLPAITAETTHNSIWMPKLSGKNVKSSADFMKLFVNMVTIP